MRLVDVCDRPKVGRPRRPKALFTGHEARLLTALAASKKPISPFDLTAVLYPDPDTMPTWGLGSVRVYASRVTAALRDLHAPWRISGHKGRGYLLVPRTTR